MTEGRLVTGKIGVAGNLERTQEPSPSSRTEPADIAADSSGVSSLVGPSDEKLVAQLRSGDSKSGEVLVQRYYGPLVRYLHRLTGSLMLAEEMHQQTWLSAMEHLDRFETSDKNAPSGFKSWLFRIATNKANDHWRSSGREKKAKEGLKLITDEELPPASHRMEATEQERKLQAAIQQLPENQRQVLMLRYYSNLKFVEIAEVVGCPLNTALGRMHKAMQRLKELMA